MYSHPAEEPVHHISVSPNHTLIAASLAGGSVQIFRALSESDHSTKNLELRLFNATFELVNTVRAGWGKVPGRILRTAWDEDESTLYAGNSRGQVWRLVLNGGSSPFTVNGFDCERSLTNLPHPDRQYRQCCLHRTHRALTDVRTEETSTSGDHANCRICIGSDTACNPRIRQLDSACRT